MKRRERWQARWFGRLLRLYPEWFRREHGEEMRDLFGARLSRARGVRGMLRLWFRVMTDALATAVALRRTENEPAGGRRTLSTLGHDVRHAARQLMRAPLFTAGAAALLAVGLGANTMVFTLVDALLFRPPPYGDAERVVYVYQDSDEGEPSSSAFPAYEDMVRSEVFAAVAATSPGTASWERAEGPLDATIEFTTASYLDVLGLRPMVGRWFAPEEDVVGNALVAVVSAATWRSRMGADPSVIGSTVRLNGQPVTIVGVGPERLSGTYAPMVTDFWLSISSTPVGGPYRVTNLERREDHWYDVRARLAPGVTREQAQSAMDALAQAMGEAYPALDRGRGITVFRAADVRIHPQQDGLLYSSAGLLAAIVITLLLLACANLANLLLARGIGRTGEMAVRRAIGAGAGRVARLFVIEALLLSATGGVVGVLLARWGLTLIDAVPLPSPLSSNLDLSIDARVGVFTILLVAATGVLAGLAPALRSARQSVASVIRDDRRTSPAGRGTVRLRNLLVAVQVGASLVLILGAGLLGRSLAALQRVDTGVDPDRVAWVRTSFDQSGLTGDALAAALEQLLASMQSIPGVTHAALASRLPATPSGTTTTVVEGYTPPNGTGATELSFTVVSPDYFEATGLALREGRVFNASDIRGAERVVLVNETAARAFWGNNNVLGKRLTAQGSPDFYRIVIGVVADAPVNSLTENTRPMFYGVTTQALITSPYVLVRTDANAAALLTPMRNQIRTVGASLPILAQGTLASYFDQRLAGPRFAARMMGAVSLLAMVLAGLGTYAVVAFGVARRAGEMGIRLALGAAQGRVIRMVVGETATTVAFGLAVGVTIAVVAAPRLESVLFGVAPLDPLTFGGAVLLLAAVAGLAAYLPARRAAKADPVRSLRAS
jgi:predicted permease